MKTITINVTQEDINNNNKSEHGKRCRTCPIAAAMTRALGYQIECARGIWRYYEINPEAWHSLPKELDVKFIALDDRESVEPFSFELTLT